MPSGNKRISIDFESSKEVVRQRLRYDKNGFLQILSFTISQGRTDIFSLILNGDEIAQRFENNNESAVITSSVQRDFSAIEITGSDKEGNAVFSFRRKKGENYFKPLDVDQMKELNDQLNRQRREIEAIIPTVP